MRKSKKTLLWTVSAEGLSDPCYVFGTMHAKSEMAFEGLDFIKSRIDRCQAFAAEFDFSEMDQAQWSKSMSLEDGQRLQTLLAPNTYKRLDKILLRETGISIQQFDGTKPILLSNFLAEAQLSDDRDKFLDAALFAHAQQIGKELLGLESFHAQMEILRHVPMKEQLKSLKEIATNFKAYRRQIKKIATLYAKADLVKILKKVKQTVGGLRKSMLYDRNITMADRMVELGRERSLFAAIGSAHLGGKKGVLKLLKDKGCRVFPIVYNRL